MLTTRELQDEIIRLKKEKDICILAHAYQSHDIWEVADYVGDSYGLSVQAAKGSAEHCADVRSPFYGRDGQDSVPTEKGIVIQQQCGMSDGRTDGCGTDFRGEKDVSGLYRGSVY